MIDTLLEPFGYAYMFNAIWVSSMVGAVCAFLSAYLMLKGWSLIGDALSHSIVPGVAGLCFCLNTFYRSIPKTVKSAQSGSLGGKLCERSRGETYRS